MNDVGLAALWTMTLGAGLGGAVVVKRLGVPTTYVRDMLHIGAGVWVLSWPSWGAPALPIALVALAVVVTVAVPIVAPRLHFAGALRSSVSGGDERWDGLVRYTVAYLIFTAVGLSGDPVPAATALLALSLGDGLGGLVGRRFGAHFYQAPGGKRKSLEGSVTVAAAAMLGAILVGAWFGAPIDPTSVVVVGLVAALAEAFAPAGTDNLLVPIAVWTALWVLS